jgi:hypothetical protein
MMRTGSIDLVELKEIVSAYSDLYSRYMRAISEYEEDTND